MSGGTVMVRRGADDVFGTARQVRSVLDAWTASPARFREDANAEQDLALGGYRDRLVVELAQNAADAAARAGVPGRIRFVLTGAGTGAGAGGGGGGVLVAANTGAPLDAAGVESLATLRASAKRDAELPGGANAVGRFGVGFSAVLAVSDEPAVLSRTGAVRWSLAEARELVRGAGAGAGTGDLEEEVRRREGHVPLLRLPLPAEGAPPEGYDTAVVLPLRDAAAGELARRLLADVDDALLLALPGLAEVVIESDGGAARAVRTLTRSEEDGHVVITETSEDGSRTTRWRTATAAGRAEPALLADRPSEERLRPEWSLTWAVPVDADGSPAAPRTAPVVHAPTPTDEPLGLPALLVASLPLEPTRRHVAPGPLTDHLLRHAADTYAGLLREWQPLGPGVVDLVPGPLGRGELDGALRRLLLERLPRVPFLPPAAPPADEDGDEGPPALRPRDAELLEGAGAATVAVLAELFPSLLPAGLERRAELRVLDVARIPLGEVVDRLAGVERPPSWWRRLYDSLAGTDPDRLTGLPVPLADGRTAPSPRTVLLPQPGGDAEDRSAALGALGLAVAHPDAVHPLLEKLGATPATPRAVLRTPQVRSAVAASLDAAEDAPAPYDGHDGHTVGAPDPDTLAETVLGLARDAALAPGDEPWLAALALPDEDGEYAPAGELLLPGSEFAALVRPGELAECDQELAERWGEQPLAAVGVLASFQLVRATDVVLDPDELEPREGDFAEPDDAGLLDAVDVWCEDVLDALPETSLPPVVAELVAVRDLDLVDDAQWPRALALLSRPPLRDALTAPVHVLMPDGTRERVRPYTAWWLRGHPVLDGRRPAGLRAAGADDLLDGLYEEADASALSGPDGRPDTEVLRALGVRTSAAALLDEPGGAAELLGRLADPDGEVTPEQLRGLYGLLADMDPREVTLPDRLRAVVGPGGGHTAVVEAADALVADAPDLLALAGDRPLLPVRPSRAADLAAVLDVRPLSAAVEGAVSGDGGAEREVPAAVRALLPGAPARYVEHDELLLDGVPADWRLTPDGTVHAATLEGLAAGLAWAAGAWARRLEAAALLEDPSRAAELARARWWED